MTTTGNSKQVQVSWGRGLSQVGHCSHCKGIFNTVYGCYGPNGVPSAPMWKPESLVPQNVTVSGRLGVSVGQATSYWFQLRSWSQFLGSEFEPCIGLCATKWSLLGIVSAPHFTSNHHFGFEAAAWYWPCSCSLTCLHSGSLSLKIKKL